jgi:hypothetical protein
MVHKLINNLYTRKGWGNLMHLFVWSDNCLEQFKNQWMLGWAINFGNRNEMIIILNYLAPLHGKRTVDGEGFLTLFILSHLFSHQDNSSNNFFFQMHIRGNLQAILRRLLQAP